MRAGCESNTGRGVPLSIWRELWIRIAFWKNTRKLRAEERVTQAMKELHPTWVKKGFVKKPN